MNSETPKVKDSKAPAISRAAAVLRLLGKSDGPLGLNPIARELGINPSTCLYVLRALVAEELVEFDADTKRYALAAGVLTLARQWLAQVAATRAQGFGVDEGNYISGVTVLAAPVWKNRGRPSHALVALGVGAALRTGRGELEQALLAAARSLSGQMGG